MTPRAVCRILLAALILLGPIFTDWIAPTQLWAAPADLKPVASSAPSIAAPVKANPVIPNSPSNCNFNSDTTNPANKIWTGIHGTDYNSTVTGQQYAYEKSRVVLIDVTNPNNPVYIATDTVKHKVVVDQNPNLPYYGFPNQSVGDTPYEGATVITSTMIFKLLFLPPLVSGDGFLPVYYPQATDINSAARLTFNQQCFVINADTGVQLTSNDNNNGNPSLLNTYIHTVGALAGQLFIRNSGNPITTGVPISSSSVDLYLAKSNQPDTPDAPASNSIQSPGFITETTTDFNGNFMVDLPDTVTPGSYIFLRFKKQDYQTHWWSLYSSEGGAPVDSEAIPSSFTPVQKANLVQVIANNYITSTTYSKTFYPAKAAGTPLIAQMVANNTIYGTISTTQGSPEGSYAVAYVGSGANAFVAGQSAQVDATGVYSIPKLSNYVTYTVKFVAPTGAPYIGEWYDNVRQVLNTNANKLYTTIPGSAGDFNNKNGQLTPGASLTGTVTASGGTKDGAKLQSVEVSLYSVDANGQNSLVAKTLTDNTGTYTFDGVLDVGNYKLSFRDTDINPVTSNPEYIGGWWASNTALPGGFPSAALSGALTLTVTEANINPSITKTAFVQLKAGNVIAGNISGYPTTGFSQVEIVVKDVNLNAVVQDFIQPITNGVYRTAPLADGTYIIQFIVPPPASTTEVGYLSGYYNATASNHRVDVEAQATRLVINGSSVSPINITLEQGAGLTIRVLTRADDGTLANYNGVTVQVVKPDGDGNPFNDVPIATQITEGAGNDAGLVHFSTLPVGPVSVYLFPSGNGAPSFNLTDPNGVDHSVINLSRGVYSGSAINQVGTPTTYTVGYTAVITKAANISGILKLSGQPNFDLSGTTIQAFRSDNNAYTPVLITQMYFDQFVGGWQYSAKLQGGSYRLKYIPPANSNLLPQFFDAVYNYETYNDNTNNKTYLGATVNPLSPGSSHDYFSVNFNPGGSFKVQVVDKTTCDSQGNNCTPITGTVMSIYTGTTASTPILSEASGKDVSINGQVTYGMIYHRPLTGTNYILKFEGPAHTPPYMTTYYNNQPSQSFGTPVTPTDGKYVTLTVKMAPAGRITGLVTLNNGPIPGAATVIAYDALTLQPYPSTTTDASGLYTLTVPAGNYYVGFTYVSNSGYYNAKTSLGLANSVVVAALPAVTTNINYNFANIKCVVTSHSLGASGTQTATLTYQTNCLGNTIVKYSTTPNDANAVTNTDPAIVASHDVNLTGLQPNTTYYLKLSSNVITSTAPSDVYGEIAIRTAADGRVWYFAAGNDNSNVLTGTVETFHILNNNSGSNITVHLSYYGTAGLISHTTVSVPGYQRLDVDTTTILGSQLEHSTVITVDSNTVPILVERTLRTGQYTTMGTSTSGGYTIPGSTTPGFDWYFPDVDSAGDNYFTLYNPNTIAGCFSVYYYQNNGTTSPTPVDGKTVPALSRVKFSVRDVLYQPGNITTTTFGVYIKSASTGCTAGTSEVVPLVVEQETYFSQYYPVARKGVSGTFGIPARQFSWIFSDGLVKAVDSQNYVFLNPVGAPTVVTITYQMEQPPAGVTNTQKVVTYTLPANSRYSIPITNPNASQAGRVYGFSVQITAQRPVAIQRSASFQLQPVPGYDGRFAEPAFTRYSNRWLFAGGDTNNSPNTARVSDLSYIVTNPDLFSTATVSFTYFIVGQGLPVTKTIQLPPNTRQVVLPGLPAGIGTGQLAGVQIDSSGPAIVAERVYYWQYNSWIGGNATFGYIPPGF